ANAGQSQLERARDRRRGEREHMHFGTKLFELLFVGDAEMLLLIYDQKAEILELDAAAKQCVCADHDIDLAVSHALLGLCQIGCGHEPRGLAYFHREAAEALSEGLEMLPRQKRRRHNHRNLL